MGIVPESLEVSESRRKYYVESLSYSHNKNIIAESGKISKSVLKKFGIDQDVYYGHIEWDSILKIIKSNKIQYRELPKYPAVRRDLALLVNSDIKFRQISDLAFRTEKNILRDVNLFDVYENESLGRNKKSYAVSFILQDELKTLTDNNIDRVIDNFIRVFEREIGAQIRR
jgi:phenylalanyl-tRNA synthetase beta chain